MTDDLDALIALAQAAVWKPKPFNDHRDDLHALHDALTPETVLGLVERVKAAEAAREEALDEAEEWSVMAAAPENFMINRCTNCTKLETGIRALCDQADADANVFIPGADIYQMPFVAADKLRALLDD